MSAHTIAYLWFVIETLTKLKLAYDFLTGEIMDFVESNLFKGTFFCTQIVLSMQFSGLILF